MRAAVSGLALLLTACAAGAPVASVDLSDADNLCPRLVAFARSVPPGQARSVTLSGEGLLGTQTCERGDVDFNPGGAVLCKWWVVNSYREFFGENFRDVADCLLKGQTVVSPDKFEHEESESGYVQSGRLMLMRVASIDKDLAADVTFNLPDVGVEPVLALRITFTNHAGK